MPLPSGEVAAKPTERAQLCAKNPLTCFAGALPKGEPMDALVHLVLIRKFTRRGDLWSPAGVQRTPLQTNFGRDVVFSADFCYNGTNEKPRPLGEVAAKPTERAQLCAKNPLTRYRGSSAFGCARSSLGVWALP